MIYIFCILLLHSVTKIINNIVTLVTTHQMEFMLYSYQRESALYTSICHVNFYIYNRMNIWIARSRKADTFCLQMAKDGFE